VKTYSSPPDTQFEYIDQCNLCGSRDLQGYWSCEGFRYVRCGNCGLIIQNPRPPGERISQRYGQSYLEYELANEDNFFRLMLLGLQDVNFPEIEEDIGTDKTFLDIGCATGKLLEYMKKKGWKEQGVEICRESAQYGIEKRNLSVFIGELREAGFADNFFSVVHCSHLVEHLRDPKDFFHRVFRLLRKDGYFICTTPNSDGFQGKLKKETWRSAIADHLFLFSRKTLKRYLQDAGFTIIKLKTWGGIPAGEAPEPVKRIADISAKFFGFGDVMIALGRK